MNLNLIITNANLIVVGISIVSVIVYVLFITWISTNWKRSVKDEYEEKLGKANLKISEQDAYVQSLLKSNKILLTRLSDRAREIEDLHAIIYSTGVFRNSKGRFQRIEQ